MTTFTRKLVNINIHDLLFTIIKKELDLTKKDLEVFYLFIILINKNLNYKIIFLLL